MRVRVRVRVCVCVFVSKANQTTIRPISLPGCVKLVVGAHGVVPEESLGPLTAALWNTHTQRHEYIHHPTTAAGKEQLGVGGCEDHRAYNTLPADSHSRA